MQDDFNKRDEGSEWATYSDLFSSISIVFLIMFLISFLKAGVSSIETALAAKVHQEELKAKISKEDLAKSEQKAKVVDKNIAEITEYEQVIDKKMMELSSFVKKLQENKSIMREMIEEQKKKDSMLNHASNELEKKEQEIIKKIENQKHLEEEVATLEEKKKKIEIESQKLNEIIVEKDNLIAGKEQEMKSRLDLLQQNTQTKLAMAENQTADKISRIKNESDQQVMQIKNNAQQSIAKLKVDADNLVARTAAESENKVNYIKKESGEHLLHLQKELDGLKNDISGKNNELSKLLSDKTKSENQFSKIVTQKNQLEGDLQKADLSFKQLQDEKNSLRNQLSQMERDRQMHNKELDKLKGVHEGELGKLKGDIAGLRGQIDENLGMANGWKNKYNDALGKVKILNDQLKNSDGRLKNLAKNLGEIKEKLRTGVANSLKTKFADTGLSVSVDDKTGSLILHTGDNFLFKKSSAELSANAQEAIKKIAPLYAEVIFGNNEIADKIESINIAGHSSPSFKGKFIDIEKDSPEAFSFNMKLSGLRASSIASFIMGDTIGDYKYKTALRKNIQSIGKGYSDPISQTLLPVRELASLKANIKKINKQQNCGPYDCSKSQRVEIGFTLKDDLKSVEKFIDQFRTNEIAK